MSEDSRPVAWPMLSEVDAGRALSEWLLAETVRDIRSKLAPEATLYDRLHLSALIRRALVDRHPLVDAARSRLQIPKPSFSFAPHIDRVYSNPDGANNQHRLRRVPIGNLSHSATETISFSHAGFLKARVGVLSGTPITVRDLVVYFANVYGGVHHGTPKNEVEKFLHQSLVSVEIMRTMMFGHLTRIAVATADALEPIAEAVTASPVRWSAQNAWRGDLPETSLFEQNSPQPPSSEAPLR